MTDEEPRDDVVDEPIEDPLITSFPDEDAVDQGDAPSA